MNAVDVLASLKALGVDLEVVGDTLRYRPKSVVPPDLVEELRQHKPVIINLLLRPAG